MLEAGLTAQRIFQDLRAGHGFMGSYAAVKRFVAGLKLSLPQRVWRIECEPGEELQVDFTMGPMLPVADGKKRRCWIFRAVLSFSRKGYSEAVFRQDTESFLRVLENALRAFGGAPLLLNLDNLKAAVTKADWFDPVFSPKFAEFCRHYAMTPMPCRAYTPEHKGKVERSIQYLCDNALKGLTFASLIALNDHLRRWETAVADTRIHGTTRQQVGANFEQIERKALRALPLALFPAYQEARRLVGRDGYVEVQKAYYEAPVEYIGRSLWVRWDSRSVRLCNDKMEHLAVHVRLEPGAFSRSRGVRGLDQAGSIKRTTVYWQQRAQAIGPSAGLWASQALERRGAEAIRSVMGLCHLLRRHRSAQIDEGCRRALAALSGGAPSLRVLRELLKAGEPGGLVQGLIPGFAESHPIIRPLSTYSDLIEAHGAAFSPNPASAPTPDNNPDNNDYEQPRSLEETSSPTAA